MAVVQVNERALMGEAGWLPGSFEDVVLVRRLLIRSGVRREQVDPLVTWLVLKAAGEEDTTASTTRSRYRKILAGLESPLPSVQRSGITVQRPLAA
jgi:hypothetical protein